jgi:hypothetical protein
VTIPEALARLERGMAKEAQIAAWSLEGPARLEAEWNVAMYEGDPGQYRTTVVDSSGVFIAEELGRAADHIALQNPERTLRRVAAYRKILNEHRRTPAGNCEVCRDWDYRDWNPVLWPCPTVQALAGIYTEDEQ